MILDKNSGLMINYDLQINKMILLMIKGILKYCAIKGLPGGHHFYIKFQTKHQDFTILDPENNTPDLELLSKYPNDMTIVLQNAFHELSVDHNMFSVLLTFNGKPRKLMIPFSSLLTFFDPFANFSVKLDPEKILLSESSDTNDILDFFEYDIYEVYDEEEDIFENEYIADILRYDYEKYKIDENQKIIYLDEIRQRVANN